MNNLILNKEIEFYRNLLITETNNIENYYLKELYGFSESTIYNHLASISKLFESNKQRDNNTSHKDGKFKLIHSNVNLLTKKDISELLMCKWWRNLSKSTQKNYLSRFKRYLKFSNRDDLIEYLPKEIKSQKRELSKVKLISRKDLNLILNNCGLKLRTLLMIMYEGALRKGEVLSIKREDLDLSKGGKAVLHITKSKTKKRDIILWESVPYIRDYLSRYDFLPNDKLFNYKNDNTLNSHLSYVGSKLSKKYPKEWNGKNLYPHLFRHSRLTELALSKLNEPQIRKFAGWKPGSNMPEVYFHLDDSDLEEILEPEYIKKKKPKEPEKPKEKEPKVCLVCNSENPQENLFCFNCGNILKETKEGEEVEIGVELITQPYKIEQIRKENMELKEELKELKDAITSIKDVMTNEVFTALKREFLKHREPEEQPEISEPDYYPIE